MKNVFRVMLFVTAALVMFTGTAHAQAAGIFGKVTDSSGGVLPGVVVTVAGPTLQQALTQVTTETGAFQFPVVPIGTYTVTFELSGFKKVVRPNIVLTSGFSAPVNPRMEVGNMSEEVTVSAAAPVVDTKKTTVGGTFTAEILEKIPTARDPWQIINMTPGVQAGLNVGGSSSGQQVGLQSRGTSGSVQWNLEGGSITDMASNSSPAYFNFDSFEQIAVVNGGGDVSVQSSGLSINLITKSGSNVFKGSMVGTYEDDRMQSSNVSEDLFARGTGGFLSGNPIQKITNISAEYGGPILKNRLWFWGAADKQDINVGVLNYFDPTKGGRCAEFAQAQRTGGLSSLVTFNDLAAVQDCLAKDNTTIKNRNAKLNYQLTASHKLQLSVNDDNKVRNSRGASASTAKESTSVQYSDKRWGMYGPQIQGTWTWIASDKLVFNTIGTYVNGGFFLDFQDKFTCGDSRYLGSEDFNAYKTGDRADPNCLWNTQTLYLQTTGFFSRSKTSSYQSVRHSTDIKTDGTYFLTNVLGGDHSLKFGAGYRKNPQLSFSHYGGGARARVQCVGNSEANCGDGTFAAVGSATGLVPYYAEVYRDQLRNNKWWSYNGYIQDSFSRGKLRVNAGLRYDWQQSSYLGGCIPANEILPTLLPSQCDDAATGGINPITGANEELTPFSNLSPRMSLTYDLKGDGKTALRASGSFYYASKITLANALGGLFDVTALYYGSNSSSGACRGSSCWTDANVDGIIQVNELTGTPGVSSSRFNVTTGVLTAAGNRVDKSAQLGRTREMTVGASHELIPNMAVGVDYIYRKYDRGTTNFTLGYEPGAAGFPISNLYTGPLSYTDPVTGNTGNYYVICATCVRPSGLGSITMTNPNYQNYSGVDFTINKRYSDKWQLNMALTVQKRADFSVDGGFTNPTGREYSQGVSNLSRYVFKLNGSYDLPYGITSSMNLNINDGSTRGLVVNGPGPVFGGGTSTIGYSTIAFQKTNAVRYEKTALLDLSLQKTFTFRGGQNRVKFMLDGFNVLNQATVRGYSSNNLSITNSSRVSSILPARVFRIGTQINF